MRWRQRVVEEKQQFGPQAQYQPAGPGQGPRTHLAAASLAGITDLRLSSPANVVQRAGVLCAGQHVLGNRSLQRLLSLVKTTVVHEGHAGTVLQRKLPDVNLPKSALKYPPALVSLIKAYRASKTLAAGTKAVAAAAKWLEGQGLVRYSNQADILPGSPEFRLQPSMKAKEVSEQTGGEAPSSTAGIAFLYDAPQGKPRYKVEIYPDAFRGETEQDAAGYLAGVVTHEYIHLLQFRKGGKFSDAQREFQAWLWQGENALRMGVRPNREVSVQIISNLENYYKQLPAADKKAYKARYDAVWKAIQPPIKLP